MKINWLFSLVLVAGFCFNASARQDAVKPYVLSSPGASEQPPQQPLVPADTFSGLQFSGVGLTLNIPNFGIALRFESDHRFCLELISSLSIRMMLQQRNDYRRTFYYISLGPPNIKNWMGSIGGGCEWFVGNVGIELDGSIWLIYVNSGTDGFWFKSRRGEIYPIPMVGIGLYYNSDEFIERYKKRPRIK